MVSRSRVASTLHIVVVLALLSACAPLDSALRLVSAPAIAGPAGLSALQASAAFVPGFGQDDPGILFHTLGSAGTVLFRQHAVVFPAPPQASGVDLLAKVQGSAKAGRYAAAERSDVILRFESADPATEVLGEAQLPGTVNYFLGSDPAAWRTGISTYARIVYERLYRGIDLVYEGGDGLLRGTFTVGPGADPATIRWRYDGASRVDLKRGELLIDVEGNGEEGLLVERKPVAWQTVDGKRRAVRVRYVLGDDSSIGFALGRYDDAHDLMIDPDIVYSTYFGGSDDDASFELALDADDNVYIAGSTESFGAGGGDIMVAKLDPSEGALSQLIYTTYLGGANEDTATGIGVDDAGNLYVAGYSYSDDFPPVGSPYQTNLKGPEDGVVVQLDGSDGSVTYASYLGGADLDEIRQLAIGDNTPMYVVGYTLSDDFPTRNAYQTFGDQGGYAAFVAVIDPSKSGDPSLVYSTCFGGDSWDEGYAIDVKDGIITFGGFTRSDPLPLKNPVQTTYGGSGTNGIGDGFVAKLDPTRAGGDQLLFSTYLGGSGDDNVGGIAVAETGDVYAVGVTESTDFTTTAVSPPYGGGYWDGFAVKLRTNSSELLFSRFLGGSESDGAKDVTLDGYGNAHVTGGTGSPDFPTVDPVQGTFGGGHGNTYPNSWLTNDSPGDAFAATFDSDGVMTFGTYLGGSGDEAGFGIALDSTNRICVTGATESDDYYAVQAAQPTNAGGFDAFVTCLEEIQLVGGASQPVSLSNTWAFRVLSSAAPWLAVAAVAFIGALGGFLMRRRHL